MTTLRCYALAPEPPPLVPADPSRGWMDAFPDRHPYRCLPLAIANAYGWEVLSPRDFEVSWTGGDEAEALTFTALDGEPWLEHFVQSNFTRGIVTFHTGYLFRTEPGWDVRVTGPVNRPKDGIAPLTGVVETDWLPYPFTMNWQMTRPGTVRFERGEPFCTVMPVRRVAIEAIEPEVLALDSDPGLKAQYEAWLAQRATFMEKFHQGDAETLKQAWQRFYFRGERPDAEGVAAGHRSKLRLKAPVDRRS